MRRACGRPCAAIACSVVWRGERALRRREGEEHARGHGDRVRRGVGAALLGRGRRRSRGHGVLAGGRRPAENLGAPPVWR
eukprot:3652009-Alexandrium_andersonii.AAC.1